MDKIISALTEKNKDIKTVSGFLHQGEARVILPVQRFQELYNFWKSLDGNSLAEISTGRSFDRNGVESAYFYFKGRIEFIDIVLDITENKKQSPHGSRIVQGTVKSVADVGGMYGSVYNMTVILENGTEVSGPVPQEIKDVKANDKIKFGGNFKQFKSRDFSTFTLRTDVQAEIL